MKLKAENRNHKQENRKHRSTMVEKGSSFDASNDGGVICYLNHAKEATLSPAVRLAGQEALTRPVWEAPTDDRKEIRRLFASLIGAEPEDIAIMASTAFAMTVAANNIGRTGGGKIVVLQDQMCSQVYCWQKIIKENNGERFEFDAVPPCDDLTQAILERLDEHVAAVSIPPLHWSHGSLVDLEVVSSKCRDLNIPLIIDATQAVGIFPIDVKKLEPTFIACSIQKWLRAPQGLSLVYINPTVIDSWEPLDQHGRSRDFGKPDWNAYPGEMDIKKGYAETFMPGACKFDSGGNVNPILLAMLRASLQEVVQLDVHEAQAKLQKLMQPLLDWATTRKGMWIPQYHAYHLVGLKPNACSVEEMLRVCTELESEGIYITVRNGVYRVSPYLTTTAEDIQRLIEGLEKFT